LKGFDKKSSISLLIFLRLHRFHNLPYYPALRRPLHFCHGLRVPLDFFVEFWRTEIRPEPAQLVANDD
jgi:hypothetical protein